MSIWTIWTAVAALLLIVEVLTQMIWTLCLALGCLAALAAWALGATIEWQLTAMSIGALLSYVLIAPQLVKWHKRNAADHRSRTGMDALLGRKAVVTHHIEPGKTGRVKIDGDSWQAIAPGVAHTIPHGTEVSVASYNSIILSVTE